MRIWSLHPKYLDAKGLVAVWRETLLAQAVLLGRTRGYTKHPQLLRFRNQSDPLGAIGKYLQLVFEESLRRGYQFSEVKIHRVRKSAKMTVTKSQLKYEFQHLQSKLFVRDRRKHATNAKVAKIEAHPMFRVITGGIEPWEVGKK